jgi:hypothetical protein
LLAELVLAGELLLEATLTGTAQRIERSWLRRELDVLLGVADAVPLSLIGSIVVESLTLVTGVTALVVRTVVSFTDEADGIVPFADTEGGAGAGVTLRTSAIASAVTSSGVLSPLLC